MRIMIVAVASAAALLAMTATQGLAFPGDGPTPGPVADADGNCSVDLSDAVLIINHAFNSGSHVTVNCGNCADADGDPSDPIVILNHLFLNGPPAGLPPPMFLEVSCSGLGP